MPTAKALREYVMEILDSTCANCTHPGRHPSMLGIQETTDRIMSLLRTPKGGDGCEKLKTYEVFLEMGGIHIGMTEAGHVGVFIGTDKDAIATGDTITEAIANLPSVESRGGEAAEKAASVEGDGIDADGYHIHDRSFP